MSASLQSKHYRVIYADPPWTFATYSRKGKGRSPEAYYNCMSLADIKALPVSEWAARRLRAADVGDRPSAGEGVRHNSCVGLYL